MPQSARRRGEDLGDDTTQVSRTEISLNDYPPGDKRDTSTPRALGTGLRKYAVGNALGPEDRRVLNRWLVGATTGDTLVRAAVPGGWEVGDKPGAASNGTRNDIARVVVAGFS